MSLSFKGRANRMSYWIASLITPIIAIPSCWGVFACTVGYLTGAWTVWFVLGLIVCAIIAILVSVNMLAVAVRRYHDTGRSGWFILWNLVPIANIWAWFVAAWVAGDPGPNTYGPKP